MPALLSVFLLFSSLFYISLLFETAFTRFVAAIFVILSAVVFT